MKRVCIALCLPILFLGPFAPASAQSEVSSAEARAAQFVFVIDDSGSMVTTDPDRLAIFAVKSLVGMLDDQDEVSVVRLNGPQEGEAPPAIEPLRKNRATIERLLALDGRLAGYRGKNTRCRSGLEVTKRRLEEAYRPGVAQAVFFLTDGKCTPDDEQPSADAFLQELRSHRENLFQFYLLRFRGQVITPAVAELARKTGGETIEVGGADPTAILHPFATALSRSQGYEAYLLTPREARLAAHRGAERVRLLAVAPGPGPDLAFSIHDRQGNSPATLGRTRMGSHRYPGGRIFRFAALDYRPSVEPVTVGVDGAGAGWKVVAVPEYRLRVRLGVHQGTCDRLGASVDGVDTGATVCVVTELVNAAGKVVGGDVAGGNLKTTVRIRRPGQPESASVEMAANPLEADQARFGLLRSHLPRGDYEFEPFVTLNLSSGDAVRLHGRARHLEVSSIFIQPQPDRLDFGTVQPGVTVDRKVVFTGSFPRAPGTAQLRDRAEIPACVSVALSGAAEGRSQEILVDQGYNVALRVSPYCGPRSFSRAFETAVRLAFDTQGRSGRPMPPVELPVRFSLEYRIETPPELKVRVRGGEVKDLPLPVTGNFQGDAQFRAVLARPTEADVVWPEDRNDLVLGFPEGKKRLLRGSEGDPLQEHDFAVGAGAAPLRLRALPHRCCEAGTYETKIGLVPAASQSLPPGAGRLDPVVIPVRVEVEPAGIWACYGPLLLGLFAALLAILLLLYLYSMFRNSSFLKADAVASRLQPLVWTGYGDTVEQKNTKGEVLRLAHHGLPLGQRVLNWLRANPLRFGLPGGRYQETVELFLQPHRDIARSQISLMPERDLEKKLATQPEGFTGRLFATAAGGVTFLCVPDTDGRISRLVHQNGFLAGSAAETARPRVLKLRRAKLLKRLEEWESYQEDAAAGWQVG